MFLSFNLKPYTATSLTLWLEKYFIFIGKGFRFYHNSNIQKCFRWSDTTTSIIDNLGDTEKKQFVFSCAKQKHFIEFSNILNFKIPYKNWKIVNKKLFQWSFQRTVCLIHTTRLQPFWEKYILKLIAKMGLRQQIKPKGL